MQVKKETIIRTVILTIVMVNQIFMNFVGKPLIAFDDDTLTEWVTNIVTIVAVAWAWWENNSFTNEAIIADEELAEMKGRKK